MIIDGHRVGANHPPFVIAEMSANHNGDLSRAIALINAAVEAGASAVKLQAYDPVRLAVARGGLDKVLQSGPWAGMALGDLYRQAHTPRAWFPVLFEHAERAGITIFSSVFDEEEVDFLAGLQAPAFKISSFDASNHALIAKAASIGAPVIISTGMASNDDVRKSLVASIDGSFANAAILHCVSAYPCPIEEVNISRIQELRYTFMVEVGFSDHTLGNDAAIGAVALGACIIEKHLTLSRADGGLDAEFSAEPDEFKALVTSVSNVWKACQEPAGSVEDAHRDLRVVRAA